MRNRHLYTAGLVLLWVSIFLVTCVKQRERLSRPVQEETYGLVFDATEADDISPAGGRRALLSTLENVALEDDYDSAFAAAYANAGEPRKQTPSRRRRRLRRLRRRWRRVPELSPSIPHPPRRLALSSSRLTEPYTLEDAVREADAFENTFAVFVYDPPSDKFVALYSDKHSWRPSNDKLFMTMRSLAFLLRRLFPERFTPSSPELALAIASGDFPQVKPSALPRADGVAPVLMFGSSFRDEGLYPNMIPMPMPDEHHLLCFQHWVMEGTVCRKLKPNRHEHAETTGLEFGEENELEWDDLIPQLIWRGSNFCYLPRLTQPELRRPYAYKLRPSEQNTNELATKPLRDNYDSLSPRWKAVVLSAESELEAERTNGGLPWANIKFPRNFRPENVKFYLDGDRIHSLRGGDVKSQEERLVKYDDTEVSTGGTLRSDELARYKYHIDLGGGGGTTWTGTVQKLAMPGLLFHHVTPMKDYFHDRLVPWRHYIPVSHDLRDLRDKFDWAESHPTEAKWIADQGAAFMRYMGSEEGFDEVFREDLVAPLRRAIESYRPVETTHPGMTWREVLGASPGGVKMKPVADCSGIKGSCRPLDTDRKEVYNLVHGLYRAA